jgi:hypothetical protein
MAKSASEASAIAERKVAIDEYCFVIMSFSGNPIIETYYNYGTKKAVIALGLKCVRVDEDIFNGTISDKIRDGIDSAAIVIADLTEDRPNCYFEAGYAIARNKPVIFQRLDAPGYQAKFEFDVKDYPHILYKEPRQLRESLKGKIKYLLNAAILD